MEYAVVTYGGGEVLEGLFNAIATLLNSSGRGSIFTPLVRLGAFVGLLWITLLTIWDTPFAFFRNWLLPFYLILNVLFVPQASVWVIDPVLKFNKKVDHVPLGLAMFAGTVSSIGDVITKEAEKVFSLPDDLKYNKTGSIFASHLIKQTRTFQITNEELKENMRGFVNQCIVYDALIGHKYTLDDLKNSDDIWKLVASNASPARSFVWTPLRGPEEKSTRSAIITCREGVKKFNEVWRAEINQAGIIAGRNIFGAYAINPKAELFKYLPVTFDYMAKMAKSAEEIMQQQIMIYSVVDSVEQKSTSLGNAPNYAIRRAYLQQRSTYETLGGLAAENLPIVKNVFEALSYAAILFVLPLALLPFGWKVITQWAGLILWVQMWAPLYAVLNYIMTVAARSQSLALTAITSGNGITLANSVGLTNANADMAAMAGYLSMSIPFISYALVKGGAGAFVHLASHLGAVSQSSAGLAAGEATSGNFSFGNVSSGNINSGNTSAFQHNTSPSYSSGIFSQHDGRVSQTTSSDGQHILNVSNSNLPSSINASESISNSLSQQATTASQMAQSKMQASTESQADAYRNVIDFATHQSKQSSSGEGWSHGISTSEAKAIDQTAQLTERFAKDNNLSTSEAKRLLAGASAGIGGGRIFSASISGSAQYESGSSSQEVYAKAQDFVKQTGYREALNESSQVAKEGRFNRQDEQAHRYAEAASGSLEKANSFRKEASESLQKSASYSEAAAWTKQNATSINDNLNQEYVEWLKDQSLGGKGPMGIREASVIVANRPEMNKSYQGRFMEERQAKMEQYLNKQPIHSSKDVEQAYAKSSVVQYPETRGRDITAEQAREKGFGQEFALSDSQKQRVEQGIEKTQSQIRGQSEKVNARGADQINRTHQGLDQNSYKQAVPGLRNWQGHEQSSEKGPAHDRKDNGYLQDDVQAKQQTSSRSTQSDSPQVSDTGASTGSKDATHQQKEQRTTTKNTMLQQAESPVSSTNFLQTSGNDQASKQAIQKEHHQLDSRISPIQSHQESSHQLEQTGQSPQKSAMQNVPTQQIENPRSSISHSQMAKGDQSDKQVTHPNREERPLSQSDSRQQQEQKSNQTDTQHRDAQYRDNTDRDHTSSKQEIYKERSRQLSKLGIKEPSAPQQTETQVKQTHKSSSKPSLNRRNDS